jgi:hypothetical protein
MIKVYFQSIAGSHSELVATFIDEELYIKCFPSLERQAAKQRCFVTETIVPESIESMVAENDQAVEHTCLKWFPEDFHGSHEMMTEFFDEYNVQIIEYINELFTASKTKS